MSSPTFAQKLTAEAIGTAILVFIGAGSVPLTVFLTGDEPVRQRRAVDDLVRLRLRDLRRGLFGRPHQRLPHQPGGHDRPAGDPQDRHDDRDRLHRRPARGRVHRRRPDAHHPDRQRPGGPGPGRGRRQRQRRHRHRLRGRGHRHGDPRLHGLRCRRRRPAPAGFAGIIIGFIVYGIIILVGPITGAALNPARQIGPEILGLVIGAKTNLGDAAPGLHRRPDRRWPRRRLHVPVHRPHAHGHRAGRGGRRARPRGRLSAAPPSIPSRPDSQEDTHGDERTQPGEEAHQRGRGHRPREPGRARGRASRHRQGRPRPEPRPPRRRARSRARSR